VLFGFDQVVIWGHKLHSHTHSYVHNGFYLAFKHLGYPTYWFDDNDDVTDFDFSNALFLTEGQVDKNIPLRDDCRYILHYCRSPKYKQLIDSNRCIILQTYTDQLYEYDPFGNPVSGSQPDMEQIIQPAPYTIYDPMGKRVYMPWATDLLPHEIDYMKARLSLGNKERTVYWVGTIGGGPGGNDTEINPFIQACRENSIHFIHKNPWIKGVSVDENVDLIARSYLAPTIVGRWQSEVGYIPCRIFKNISYGQMGLTNSKVVNDLFEGRVVYNPDTYQLFYDAQKRLQTISLEEIHEAMDFVKKNHTYLNRIQVLLDFFELMESRKAL
jgi:hypothetical protein